MAAYMGRPPMGADGPYESVRRSELGALEPSSESAAGLRTNTNRIEALASGNSARRGAVPPRNSCNRPQRNPRGLDASPKLESPRRADGTSRGVFHVPVGACRRPRVSSDPEPPAVFDVSGQ